MKRAVLLLAAVLLLGSCGKEPERVSEAVSREVESAAAVSAAETSVPCEHLYGDAPVQTVGNIDIYECTRCGYQKAVQNGTLIGG